MVSHLCGDIFFTTEMGNHRERLYRENLFEPSVFRLCLLMKLLHDGVAAPYAEGAACHADARRGLSALVFC